MKIEQIQCPACGADLDIPEGRDKFFCQYCGASIHVDDEVERKEYTFHHITTDEAKIARSQAEVELQKLQMEENRRERRMKGILLTCLFLLIIFVSAVLFGWIKVF